jgi:DNA-binding IclR family transcriptional regulator
MAADPGTRAQYLSDPVQVALGLQTALLAAWPQPRSIAELVQHTGASRDQVYRGLVNLEHAGCAEETTTGWLIGERVTGAAERIRRQTVGLLTRYLPQD